MKTAIFSAAAGAALLLAATSSAEAGAVVVNGKVLDFQERMMLARYSCGPIPAGSYWLNMNTGYWGYAGSSRSQGHIKDRCQGGQARQSLSQRGLLWRPGELVTD
ncbi:MAG: hypothetical protein AAGH68_07580 [Pseudomonadota bacterium]